MFRTIRELTRQFISKIGGLKGKNGELIKEKEKVLERWKEYTTELYKTNEEPEDLNGSTYEKEPWILESEVRWALDQLPYNKAPGCENIQIELLKAIKEEVIPAMTILCNEVWEKVKLPREWKQAIFIPLPKKEDVRECSNNRTIALIPHSSRILLRIMQKRLEPYIEREMPVEQAGFRKGRGTRDEIANVRWILERTRERNKPVYLCFIDYAKAFDSVENSNLWNSMENMGIPEHLIGLIRDLYTGQETKVQVEQGATDCFPVQKGLRQGCILSPGLFNLYSEHIIRTAGLEDFEAGVKIAGRKINNLRCADDTTLLAENKDDMGQLIKRVKISSERRVLN
jgi:hypothetical protein